MGHTKVVRSGFFYYTIIYHIYQNNRRFFNKSLKSVKCQGGHLINIDKIIMCSIIIYTMRTKSGRLRLWIDREIQMRFVVYILLSLAIASAIVSIATFYTIWSDISDRIIKTGSLQQIYTASLHKFISMNIFLIILLAVLATLGMMLLSHKIAGPVYRIRQILKDLQEGKKPTFTLRKGDALKPMLEEIERFSLQQNEIGETALKVIERWKETEVKDMSLNLALKELENKLVYLTLAQEREGVKDEQQ